MQRFLNLLSGLSDIILPRSCPTCGGALPFGGGRAICETCLEALERTLPPWCPVCGKPFRSEFTLSYSPDHLCAECREWPPGFDGARALGPYDGALRNLVHLIKYHGYTSLAAELGVELSQRARQEFPGAADAGDGLITFVPIARDRWKERGFDQARLLAQSTAGRLGVAFAPTLERRAPSAPQTRLTAKRRRKILRGVFSSLNPPASEGKRVILIDDVLTTGSTASACARELKIAGALSVSVLTICLTVIKGIQNLIFYLC